MHQAGLFGDVVEVPTSPRPKTAAPRNEEFNERELADTNPRERPGLFPGTLVIEGVLVDPAEVESLKREMRSKREADRSKHPKWQCDPRDKQTVTECLRSDETRRKNAERAAAERRIVAESRRAAMATRRAPKGI